MNRIHPLHSEVPAPNIIRTEDDQHWQCTRCGGIDSCSCLGGMNDPICDCGWPAYACQCINDDDNGEKENIEEENTIDVLDFDEEICSW